MTHLIPSMVRSKSLVLLTLLFSVPVGAESGTTDWPSFRGVGAQGVANGYETPVQWDATDPDDPSVLWKSAVPGLGHSCPVIVGDRLFIATAVATDGDVPLQIGRAGNTNAADDNSEQKWMLLCFDKNTGKELWQKKVYQGVPKATRHAKATHANTTVAVSGDNVVAFFGSEGLYCYDLNGELKWKKDLGVVDVSKYGIGWGYASSPAIHDGHIVLVCDDPDHPHIIAVDLKDGEPIWRRDRDEVCERSWGTPLIHEVDGRAQVVVNGFPWIVAYDLQTGDEVWRIEGGGDNPIPTPFVANDRIYITSAHGGPSPVIAVRTDAKGNLTDTVSPQDAGLVWRVEKGGSYMSTPVVVGDYLYLGHSNGVLRCFHANTGEKLYEKRLDSGAYVVSSLVAANDKVYCTSEDGTVYVIAAGPEYKLLAKNPLGDSCLATPAISAGTIYFRTASSLMAIGPENDVAVSDVGLEARRKPNVLFIAVDDLRPTLGCYGDAHAISPNIDGLAESGMRFNRAYCQVAVCNPSRASLMTGLRPDTLGVWTLPIHFREAKPDAVTLPQWLRRFGYTAVGHGKIFHNPTPDPQSWSEPIRSLPSLPYVYPDGTRDVVRQAMEKLPANDWRKNNLRALATSAPDLPDSELLDGARTDRCIEDLRRLAKSKQPFFLAMGYIRPHLAFVAPKKYWDMYDPDKLPVLAGQATPEGAPPYAMHNNSELSHYVDLIDMPKPWDTDELAADKARRLVHGYHACVSYIDAQIGRLLKALDDEGLRENTIVVLWSDHGWKLGEYRGWGKMTNYEIDARVPLIISAPGLNNDGQCTESLVELLDLFPTLCDLAGVEIPGFVEGKSVVPILRDPDATVHSSVLSQYYRRYEDTEYMGYSMRTDRYRYIEWRDFATGELKDQELYDHQAAGDQGGFQPNLGTPETKNIAEEVDPSLLAKLSQQLQSQHPPRKLSLTPAVHTSPSGPGRLQVEFTFENRTDGDIFLQAIKPTGRRAVKRTLAPGDSVTLNARIGGVYVVESRDGSIHEIHSPCWPPRTVVIRK